MLRRLGVLFGLISLCAVGCQRSSQPSSDLIKLLNHLQKAQILESPLSGPFERGDIRENVYPQKSRPIDRVEDSGNPYLLARKLKVGGAERNILFAPPGSVYSFPIPFASGSVFEFGVGLTAGGQPAAGLAEAGNKASGVHFQVRLESRGRSKSLFEKFVELKGNEENSIFILPDQTLVLPPVDPDARVVLKTRSEGRAYSFWINPIIYREQAETTRIILISLDTLRADHLGCYGYDRDTSPNIDNLAGDSALFLNVFASSPWTLPSHVAMLTALHGVHHQVYHDDEKMAPELETLPQLLGRRGYRTAAFTGGGFVSAAYGFSRGFDSYDETSGGVFHQDSAERTWRAAETWIDRHREDSFFLFLHTYQTHSPYACPPPFKVMFLNDNSLFGHVDLLGHLGGKPNIFRPLPEAERRNIIDLYDGEIRYTDEKLIGPLITKLKTLGIYDRTLIILTSDHGEEFFDHGGWGHGHSLYNEALKVPLLIKFPHSQYRGEVRSNEVSLVDLFPTVCDILAVPYGQKELDGRSLLPILSGREVGDRDFWADLGNNILNSHIPQKIAFGREHEKLILSRRYDPEDLDFFAAPPPQVGPVEFYNLEDDPSEQRSLADDFPGRVSGIIAEVNKYYEQASRRKTQKAEVDEKLKEQLRGLGYIR